VRGSTCAGDVTADSIEEMGSTGADDATADYRGRGEVLALMTRQLTTGKRGEVLALMTRQLTVGK
jgi:hypothetical protein